MRHQAKSPQTPAATLNTRESFWIPLHDGAAGEVEKMQGKPV
jgi:hypothetical protein